MKLIGKWRILLIRFIFEIWAFLRFWLIFNIFKKEIDRIRAKIPDDSHVIGAVSGGVGK